MSDTSFAVIPRRELAKGPRIEIVSVDRGLFYFDGELYEFDRIDADD